MSSPHVWSRFETGEEGEPAWAAFSEYLHLATPRPSVEEYARAHRTPGLVLKWSMTWLWESRVEAYDQYTQQASLRKYYPVSHPLILNILRMATHELKKWEAASAKAPLEGFLSVEQCLKLLKEVRAAERDIARLQKEQEEAKASGAAVYDFSKLTIEESRAFDALLAKISLT